MKQVNPTVAKKNERKAADQAPGHELTIDRMIDIAQGKIEPEPEDHESRVARRWPYDDVVALVQMTPGGGKSIPTQVSVRNISTTGLGITSRFMLHTGHEGAILIRRQTGQPEIVGVRVVHCTYVGNMKHDCGLEFADMSGRISLDDFRDHRNELPNFTARDAA